MVLESGWGKVLVMHLRLAPLKHLLLAVAQAVLSSPVRVMLWVLPDL
jgi:hypothetical protein